jgi:site-specific recombinase XerD
MGLRVSEPLNLRIRDVLLEQSLVAVRDGKGGKDRIVPIPCALVEPLRRQMRAARVVWERDQQAGLPVALPGLLSKKYPNAQWAWAWFWVFPSHVGCTDPRSGLPVRWRMHEINVQRAVREAAAAADVGGMVTPHCLRHAYATHAMQGGAYVRDVQAVMGHASLETTMGYLHAEAGRVVSPLEGMSHELVSCATV